MKRSALRRPDGKARLSVAIPKPKTCAKHKGGCGERFTPSRRLQAACSPTCAENMATAKRQREERKADAAQRERLKPRSKWLAEAQAAFNKFIRSRDMAAGLPCVSCGRHHEGQYHAGHYLSTGARPELRFSETNVWLQCSPCNVHLHGNLVLYRAELIRRVGQAEVDRLEGPHEPKKYTVDDLRVIRDTYRAKARELTKEKA